ncbi:MAG: ABC transporter ATP-binding protein [Acidobacteriota bacterium]
MASVELQAISKTHPNGHVAVRDLTLEIADGELLVLVGPSGSGKSTVLRLIAGLDPPTTGRISIDGRDVTDLTPQQRDLAMVFQNYALYPHKSVRENLAFGLRVRGIEPALISERVRRTAASLDLEALLDRKPSQLSGGQRQRVALGRAIVREPKAFLLDEPLSNLDPLLRVATRAELILLQRRLGATMVYVTHDQEEAMTLGHRVAVMREGRVEQVGPPLVVYERPATTFVAQFVGSPAMNLWPAASARDSDRLRLTTPAFVVDLPAGAAAGSRTASVGARPHDIDLSAPDAGDIRGRVEIVEPLGAQTILHVEAAGGAGALIRVVVPASAPVRTGEQVGLLLRRDRLHLFEDDGRRVNESGPIPAGSG